jgi:hypothetical protein
VSYENLDRRFFLKAAGAAGMLSTLPEAAFGLRAGGGRIEHEVAVSGAGEETKPKYSIKFAVIGLDHAHIMGITAAVIRGGGELTAFYSTLPKEIANFQKIYPQARLAKSEDEILDDPSISATSQPLPHRSNWTKCVKFLPQPEECLPLCTLSGWRCALPCRQVIWSKQGR